MTDSLLTTIYIALIMAGVMLIALVAIQIAIFSLAQRSNFSFGKQLAKIKKTSFQALEFLLNPIAKIKAGKTKKV